MSTFVLKIIAIVAMLIDHTGAILISPHATEYPTLYLVSRGIGRIAFPIFVFLIVEGFYHTRDVKKYLKRLGIFAIISEIPFDFAFYNYNNTITNSDLITDIKSVFQNGFHVKKCEMIINRFNENQNVFFTLFLGLLLIYLMSLVEKKYMNNLFLSNLIDAALTLGACAIIYYFLHSDYEVGGILIIVSFYLFRGSNIMLSICLFVISGTVLGHFDYFMQTGNIFYIIEIFSIFAIVPIAFYNGKKGKNAKYIFYIFYPVHLLVLLGIYQFMK